MTASELVEHSKYGLSWTAREAWATDEELLSKARKAIAKMTTQQATDEMLLHVQSQSDLRKIDPSKDWMVLHLGNITDTSVIVKIPCPIYLRARILTGTVEGSTEKIVAQMLEERYDENANPIYAILLYKPDNAVYNIAEAPQRAAEPRGWMDALTRYPVGHLVDNSGKFSVLQRGDSFYAVAI